jgi:hypothetical protein
MTDSEPDVLVAGEALIDFLPDTAGSLADVETFSRRARQRRGRARLGRILALGGAGVRDFRE